MALTNLEAQKKGEYQRGVEGWAEFRREWNAVTKELKERLRKCSRLKWMYKIDLDPSLKPLMLQAINLMEAGVIGSAAFQTGGVDIKITIRGDGKIKVKWNYKDKGELEQ